MSDSVRRIIVTLGISTLVLSGSSVLTSCSKSETITEAHATTVDSVKSATLELTEQDRDILLAALEPGFFVGDDISANLRKGWTKAYIPPAIEIINFVPDRKVRETIYELLKESTGHDFGTNMNNWFRWLWNSPELKIKNYDTFKSEFYRQIDPKFGRYFAGRAESARIRLDEIRWGGVLQDGIPPCDNPI